MSSHLSEHANRARHEKNEGLEVAVELAQEIVDYLNTPAGWMLLGYEISASELRYVSMASLRALADGRLQCLPLSGDEIESGLEDVKIILEGDGRGGMVVYFCDPVKDGSAIFWYPTSEEYKGVQSMTEKRKVAKELVERDANAQGKELKGVRILHAHTSGESFAFMLVRRLSPREFCEKVGVETVKRLDAVIEREIDRCARAGANFD